MRTILVLAALAALALPPAAATGSSAWETHRKPGFSIALPSSWADATSERRRILSEARKLGTDEPDLVRIVDGLLAANAANSAVKMLAFDLAPASLRTGFATNVNVIREQTTLTFAEWKLRSLQALTSLSFVQQPIWSRTVKLPAGKALRIAYRARFTVGGKTLGASITQYGIVKPGHAHILTYTTVPVLARGYRATFERSARSFRLGARR